MDILHIQRLFCFKVADAILTGLTNLFKFKSKNLKVKN